MTIRWASFSKWTLEKKKNISGEFVMWGFTCNTLVELGYVLVNWIADCFEQIYASFCHSERNTVSTYILLWKAQLLEQRPVGKCFVYQSHQTANQWKNSEPISLPELFNTNWPLLLRLVNDVCHFNAHWNHFLLGLSQISTCDSTGQWWAAVVHLTNLWMANPPSLLQGQCLI